jgi:hypothetical protein
VQPQTINESAPETVAAINAIERQADDCYKSLGLLALPGNLAIWGALTEGIRLIEGAIATHGDNSSDLDASLINVGRSLTTAIKWVHRHGKPPSKLATLRWTPAFAQKAEQTVRTALQYAAFETAFPMWHKGRYTAQLMPPHVVRFSSLSTVRERQVSAYQKGFRPTTGEFEGKRAQKPEMRAEARRLFDATLDNAVREGQYRFRYADPWDLWEELFPEYQARASGIARRSDSLSLGSYTLGEFNRFYAAVLAVGAAHEHLCWSWGQRQSEFPIKSAVLVWNRSRWISVFSSLSGIAEQKCEAMLSDLCFVPEHSVDLHVHPFIPLDKGRFQIALAAPFPLHSLPDENILLVCSILRPEVFDAASLEKEKELIAKLTGELSRYSPEGPVGLPNPTPDIDLMIVDESDATIAICELKWMRKPIRSGKIPYSDADVTKGIRQLRQIRDYLQRFPEHLKRIGKIARPVNEYRRVQYLLVARDHWPWIEPENNLAIVEYGGFVKAMLKARSLSEALNGLLGYGWLPEEGRDFTVIFERSIVNGVAVDSEVFFPARPRQTSPAYGL